MSVLQVFQRREDGSVNFYREWAAYQEGFGKITGEHWLGKSSFQELFPFPVIFFIFFLCVFFSMYCYHDGILINNIIVYEQARAFTDEVIMLAENCKSLWSGFFLLPRWAVNNMLKLVIASKSDKHSAVRSKPFLKRKFGEILSIIFLTEKTRKLFFDNIIQWKSRSLQTCSNEAYIEVFKKK